MKKLSKLAGDSVFGVITVAKDRPRLSAQAIGLENTRVPEVQVRDLNVSAGPIGTPSTVRRVTRQAAEAHGCRAVDLDRAGPREVDQVLLVVGPPDQRELNFRCNRKRTQIADDSAKSVISPFSMGMPPPVRSM